MYTLDILIKDRRSLFSGVHDLGYFSYYVVLSSYWCHGDPSDGQRLYFKHYYIGGVGRLAAVSIRTV